MFPHLIMTDLRDIRVWYFCYFFTLLTMLLLNITVLPSRCQLWMIAKVWSWWYISLLTIRTEKDRIDKRMNNNDNNVRHKKSTYSIFRSNWGRSGRDWVKLEPQQQVQEYHIQKMMMMKICSSYVQCWNMWVLALAACDGAIPTLEQHYSHPTVVVSQRFYKFEIFFKLLQIVSALDSLTESMSLQFLLNWLRNCHWKYCMANAWQ